MSSEDFKPSRQRLKYLIGEFKLFSINLMFLEYKKHFLRITENISYIEFPQDDDPKISGIYFSSFPVRSKVPVLAMERGRIRYSPFQYTRYYIVREGSFEHYLSSFSSKSRSTLKRKVRKYDSFCNTSDNWKEYGTPKEMEDFYRHARSVSEKTYQERLLDSGLPARDWFKHSMESLAQADSVRGYILFHAEKPVAYIYCPIISGNIFLYAYVGFDPEYRQWSPGTVLQFKVLEELFSRKADFIFDFYEGQGPHKEFFATRSTNCADIYYFKKTAKNTFLVLAHISLLKVSRAVVWVLERLKLKSRIKRIMRLGFRRAPSNP